MDEETHGGTGARRRTVSTADFVGALEHGDSPPTTRYERATTSREVKPS